MKRKRSKRSGDGALSLMYMLRAALIACIITGILMIILAFFLKWEWFSLEALGITNVVIKTLCAALAGLVCTGAQKHPRLMDAGGAGVFYILLSYLVFRLIEQDFSLRWEILSDIVLAFVAAIAAALIRNFVFDQREEAKTVTKI